jgi:lysophospholipase L1-like esterase
MTRNPRLMIIAAALALMSLIAIPAFAVQGTGDFTRYVAIGDSYGAGFSSGSLNVTHQQYSYPAIIARQTGAPDFQQPLVSEPGIAGELQLLDIIKYPPTITPKSGQGAPTNLNLARPYNNLSVPGATVSDVTTLTGKESPTSTAKVFAQFILRGLGTEVDQALAQKPTFITVWIGGNDALGAVLAGTPAALTPLDTFKTAYGAMLDKLVAGAPTAGIVVGTLPTHIATAPIAGTVPPFIVDPSTRLPVLGPDGKPIYYVAALDGTGTNFGQLPPGSLVLLTAATRLATGYGIPAALKAVPPFNQLPDVGKPLPDGDVLTPTEVAAIETRVADYNTAIIAAAQARNIPVADIKGLFDRALTGVHVGPFTLNAAFLTGGVFSFDGFHMTDIGYTLFANEYIKTINTAYGKEFPVASVANYLANNSTLPTTASGLPIFKDMEYTISDEAIAQMLAMIPEAKKPTHRRVAGN